MPNDNHLLTSCTVILNISVLHFRLEAKDTIELLVNSVTPSVANCHMGTVIKHPVPDRVKPSFVIFDIRAL